jgi:NAD(P)-dependent dehydrogenase (short-subunit alcohol dehydrogenase family)
VGSTRKRDKETRRAKAVLVTGASSGFGRSIAERLAANGHFVYAGARKERDLAALDAIKNVQAVRLDVTNPKDIEAACETIEGAGRGLYGLVNNAGVVTSGPVVSTKMQEFDVIMAVNVYGPWRMVQAFAPLIRAASGRITNIGSINGIVISPEYGAYCMSKHAIEAFTEALAEEMEPLGVLVSVVEPGSYKTDLIKNQVQRSGTGAAYLEYVAQTKDPSEVAAAVEQALFEPKPKRRYLVAPNEVEARFAIEAHLQRLMELNERQPYSYDRKTLIKMLEAAVTRIERGVGFSYQWPGTGSQEHQQ